MRTHTEVVVIGGGIAGCSAIYHLTQEGITDCVLVERDELTSGTTWHSAAQVTNFGPNQTMVGLKTHSINLYRELSEDPEYPINYHHATGGLRIATTQDHLDGYYHFQSMAKGMGVEFEVLDAQESQRRHPLITTEGILGALWDPLDGDIDPAQLCQALARRARLAGAEIQRFNPVMDLTQKPDHSWIVHTKNGDIHCQTIVNAGGYRCNEISAMMGTELPVASMEHQYMVTDTLPEIEALGDDFRVPLIRCPQDDFYQRAEKKGLLIGFYEQACKTWGLDGISPDFTMDLCPDDLDRVTDVMAGAIARLPCLETAGIKSIVNGPITYTPDGLPLVGKIPGFQNAYCITGLRAGLGEGGGHGWLLAQLIAHGEAVYDTWCLDPRRFGTYADEQFTALKAVEDYQNEFRFHMPHEFRPAGRDQRTSPVKDRLAELGAEFGVVNGWERALYYKPDAEFSEVHSFKFTNDFDIVAAEVATVQNAVGIAEVCGFNAIEITGEGARDWLDSIICSRLPKSQNRVGLGYYLNHQGMVKGEMTIVDLGDRIIWGSAAASERHDLDWLNEHLPDGHKISLRNLTNDICVLVVAGPHARDTLQAAFGSEDFSAKALPWLRAKMIDQDILTMSVSFSGELAYELHIPNAKLAAVYEALLTAGAGFGIKPFGLHATESMRLEKGYLHWKADLITEFSPFETGLDRFVDMSKDFIGKEALEVVALDGPRRELRAFHLDTDHAPARGGDSVLCDGHVVGTVTSAGWGHRTDKNIFYAFVDAGTKGPFDVQMLGQTWSAQAAPFSIYDPENTLQRVS